ncbi:uncharacterized protein CBL_20321 [Carabus blaptoides fortunei]
MNPPLKRGFVPVFWHYMATWSTTPAHKYENCVYENTKYSEGSSVSTAEPCLRCACARGALLCYLRVCPELPDPPPRGCVVLHRHHTCCPELICPDLPVGGNRIEARFEPDPPEIPYNQSTIGNGCILNGTVYGSGSAMTSSSLCEYCYCINGKQQCVKPKCLMPLAGCTASYALYSCCPTHYKCSGLEKGIMSTTTTATTPVTTEYTGGGCVVSGKIYPEGGKILGVGHSPCDNCYCMQGAVRCVPLSCAPALLGCIPVVRPGECCAASYNCSGVIEVQARLNYGHYPVVSKEYAKLRKEVQQKYHHIPKPVLPSAPFLDKATQYIIAKSTHHSTDPKFMQKSSTPYYFTSTPEPTIPTILPTVRQFMATTRHLPVKLDILSPERNKYSKISLTTTKVNSHFDRSSGMRPVFKPSKLMARTALPVELTTENPTLMLSPVYKGADSPRSINNEYIAPLTTTNEIPTYSSVISKRKYENSTPKIFKYSNYVDIDFGDEIFMDGRNNRRIDDEINEESRLEIINQTTTDNPAVTETTESLQPTETTILTTTLGDFISTSAISTTDEETTTQDTTTQISTTETTLNNSTTNQIIMSSNVTMYGNSTGNSTNFIQLNSTKVLIKQNKTNLMSEMNITGTKIIGNNTECIDGSNLMTNDSESIIEHRNDDVELIEETTTDEPTTTLEPEVTSTENPNILDTMEILSKTEANNLTATLTPFKKIPPEIEAILNITKNINKKDEDYEYDYNEPSLPPSLPNLKIIPFEAADAITKEKDSVTIPYATAYPPHPQDNLRGTDDPLYGYTLNLFSPPVETEGGFVPRDPPILNTFYENVYHTTGIVDITAGTAVPAITNPPKSDEHNCIVEGREVRHGELTSEVGACSVCLCLFGDIVCQPPKCPAPPAGCRRAQPSSATPICCGHVVCNGDEESPTVVLDRIDVTSNPQENIAAEGIATHDPFRDVIRTEPAPDLQSLIGDIMPYLARHTSTLKPTTHMISTKPTASVNEPQYTSQKYQSTTDVTMETKQEDDSEFSFDSVFKLLFSDEKEAETIKPKDEIVIKKEASMTATPAQVVHAHTTTQLKYRTTPTPNTNSWYLPSKTQTDLPSRNSIEGPSSVGLLKLAGCNIYGRMYRVGRIISELSGPCLECMCTEVGVQCRPLNC